MCKLISRELTRAQRRDIRKLVEVECANFDHEHGCLPLDYGGCYMLDKWWTGAYCRYFINAVLPLNPVLEAALTGKDRFASEKTCPVCGAAYFPKTSQAYCSDACRTIGRRRSNRINQQNRRKNRGDMSST